MKAMKKPATAPNSPLNHVVPLQNARENLAEMRGTSLLLIGLAMGGGVFAGRGSTWRRSISDVRATKLAGYFSRLMCASASCNCSNV